MQIKLIAMDLDGTLMLPDHQRVGETTRRALAACRQQGVRLALATLPASTLHPMEEVIST